MSPRLLSSSLSFFVKDSDFAPCLGFSLTFPARKKFEGHPPGECESARVAQLIRAESSSNGSCRSHPALQPTCRNRPALGSSCLRSVFLLLFLRGFCSSAASCTYPLHPKWQVPAQENHRSWDHLRVAQLKSVITWLAWRVTPDSWVSTCRCQVDDEFSSTASRDGSTDFCNWRPDVLSATVEDFALQALADSAQFKYQVSSLKRCAVALVVSVMGNWLILLSWSSWQVCLLHWWHATAEAHAKQAGICVSLSRLRIRVELWGSNVLIIAAGLPGHNGVAMDFIEAVGELKRGCPCATLSAEAGAISFLVRVNIGKIIDVSDVVQRQVSTIHGATRIMDIPQNQDLDRVADMPPAMQRQRLMIRKVQSVWSGSWQHHREFYLSEIPRDRGCRDSVTFSVAAPLWFKVFECRACANVARALRREVGRPLVSSAWSETRLRRIGAQWPDDRDSLHFGSVGDRSSPAFGGRHVPGQPCCWISRVAGEIVFWSWQSDTDACCTKRVRCSTWLLKHWKEIAAYSLHHLPKEIDGKWWISLERRRQVCRVHLCFRAHDRYQVGSGYNVPYTLDGGSGEALSCWVRMVTEARDESRDTREGGNTASVPPPQVETKRGESYLVSWVCGRPWLLAFFSGSVCVWSRRVLLALLRCLVSSSGFFFFSKRGDDPGHRPKDRFFFWPTDHVQSGLSVVAGNEGRRPEDRSFGLYPFLRTALQWYWWWLLGTYFGLYRGLFFLRLLLFRSSVPTHWRELVEGTSTCRAGSLRVSCFVFRILFSYSYSGRWRTSAGGSRGDKGPVSCSLFPELGMSGDNEAEFLFSGKAEMCEVHTVVRCWSTHSKCDRFGTLWRCRRGCWSNSGWECLLGHATRREGALPAVGLQVRTLILHATGTRVPDTVLCGAVWTPWWKNPGDG